MGHRSGDDLKCVGPDLRSKRELLVCEVVDQHAVQVGCYEHHIGDGVNSDETRQSGSLGGVAFEAILRENDSEILDRLGDHDELPRHSGVLRGEQIVLQVLELLRSEHRASRIEQLHDEAPGVGRYQGVGRRELAIAIRTRIEHEEGRV